MYRTACRQPSVNGSADFGSHLACRESWWYIRGVRRATTQSAQRECFNIVASPNSTTRGQQNRWVIPANSRTLFQ